MAGSLRLKQLKIESMPGIGGYELTSLSEGVNLVYGPNESGKSTAARSIQKILWPASEPADAELQAQVLVDHSLMNCTVVNKAAHWLCESKVTEPPPVPPPNASKRYMLSLRSLVSEDDQDLAGEVVRQAGGGCDINAAAKALGFNLTPQVKRERVTALKDAQVAANAAKQASDAVAEEVKQLAGLREQQLEATAAAELAQQAVRALKVLQTKTALELCQHELASFPEQMGHLTGNELEQWEQRSQQIQSEQERAQKALQVQQDKAAEIANLGFGESGPDEKVITQLRTQAADLEKAEANLAQARKELAGALAQADSARSAVGHAIDPAAVTLTSEDVGNVSSAAMEVEAKAEAVAALQQRLDLCTPNPVELSSDALLRAHDLLGQWLNSGDGAPASARGPAPVLLMLVNGCGLAAGLVLGALSHPAWLGLAAASALSLLLLFLLWQNRASTSGVGRSGIQQQYEALGVVGPGCWTAAQVTQRRQQIDDQRKQALLNEAKAAERPGLEARLQKETAELEKLRINCATVAARLGLKDIGPHQISFFIARLGNWQSANDVVQQLEAEVRHLEEEVQEQLAQANLLLGACGQKPCEDATSARASARLVDDHAISYKAAVAEINSARHTEAASREVIAARKDEIHELLASVGLPPSASKEDLALLLNDLPAYREARDRCRTAEAAYNAASSDASGDPSLPASTIGSLTAIKDQAAQKAATLQSLSEEIGCLENHISDFSSSTSVEDANCRVADAVAALEEQLDGDACAIAGQLFADHLQKEVLKRSLPAVFHRANDLFALFTDGRWKLALDDLSTRSFRAVRPDGGLSHSVEQLSTGTRTQLLIAVRLAFVESQETIKLPIMLDETLANSDEDRAETIVRTVAKLADQGRQVFYFTTKSHEVELWKRVLEEEGVQFTQLDLAEIRHLETGKV